MPIIAWPIGLPLRRFRSSVAVGAGRALHAALAIGSLAMGSLASSAFLATSSLFLTFTTGATAGDFFAGLSYCDSFSSSASSSARRAATFSINLSAALSRNAATSSMLSESRSIFAMQASCSLVATGQVHGPQEAGGLIHRDVASHTRRCALHTPESQSCNAISPFTPQSRTSMDMGHDSKKRMGMTESQDR